MSEDQAPFDGVHKRPGGVFRIWEPTPELRWVRPPDTSAEPAALEQLWRHSRSGREEWRPVPVVVAPT